ncbi:MAG TPA: hypothetical protein VGG36_10235 [Rhizomicrobium sp.]|jgi:uncharacterized membrane protein
MRMFPLLLIVVIIYNLLVFGHGFASHVEMEAFLTHHAIPIHMFSGDNWNFSIGDGVLLLGLVLLFVEIVKATRTTSHEIINHALSMVTFVIALIEFITLKGFSTSTFFFVTAFTVFDVIAGYTISIMAAEHDLGMGRGANTD